MSRRKTFRPSPYEDGPMNYLGSVSDLMAGLIFVFILTVVFFAIELRQKQEELVNTDSLKRELLENLKDDLEAEGITVTIVEDQGVLRLAEQLLFPSGQARLTDSGLETLKTLRRILSSVLSCYAAGPADSRGADCDDENAARLDSVFIEGHTDDVPLRADSEFRDNWHLSAARSIQTYMVLIDSVDGGVLKSLVNRDSSPILGVSAYADSRGVEDNRDERTRAQNRRIELRFLMVPPREGIETRARRATSEVEEGMLQVELP